MFYLIPLFINRRVMETVIRAEIDDAHGIFGDGKPDFHRVACGQSDEDKIAVLRNALDILHAFQRSVEKTEKMRINF